VIVNLPPAGNKTEHSRRYLPEAAHPCHVLKRSGFGMDFASPRGDLISNLRRLTPADKCVGRELSPRSSLRLTVCCLIQGKLI
jgi:hypothetical protein